MPSLEVDSLNSGIISMVCKMEIFQVETHRVMDGSRYDPNT